MQVITAVTDMVVPVIFPRTPTLPTDAPVTTGCSTALADRHHVTAVALSKCPRQNLSDRSIEVTGNEMVCSDLPQLGNYRLAQAFYFLRAAGVKMTT